MLYLIIALWILGCYPTAICVNQFRPEYRATRFFLTIALWPITTAGILLMFVCTQFNK